MTVKNALFMAGLGAVIATLAGCASSLNTADSSEFGCPGMPQGVTCKTPREVYKMTNKEFNDIGTAGDNDTVRKTGGGQPGEGNAGLVYQPVQMAAGSVLTPVPMVEPAKVLRIWIAPWVDKNKDLHWPGLVFTKVQKNQWNVGEESFDGVDPPVPFQILRQSGAQVAPAPQAKQDHGGQSSGVPGFGGGEGISVPPMPSGDLNLN